MASEQINAILTAPLTPENITLLFKRHKSTTLLSVPPTQSFTEIKFLLIVALRSRGLVHLPNTRTPIPSDPEELEFAVLVDRRDRSKGWTALDIREQEIADTKGNKHKVGGKKSVVNESPVGAGLVDGTYIAYRIRTTPAKDMDIDDEDSGWDVVFPSIQE